MSNLVNLWNEIYSIFNGTDEVHHNCFVNIYRERGKLHMQIAAPGHGTDDFIIAYNLNYRQLSVRAEKPKHVKKVSQWLRHEFEVDAFNRIFQVDLLLDKDEMKKTYRNGILYLEFPIVEEEGTR